MRCAFVALCLLSVLATAGPAVAQEAEPEVIAIVEATVLPVDGEPLDDATVVVRDGRIAAVGADVAIPEGARRVDASGSVVTPGFVATGSPLGLVEISLEPSTRDAKPEGDGEDDVPRFDEVRAAFSAADGFDPGSTLIPVARMGGVTNAVSTPVGGLVSGTSAWLDLAGSTPGEMLAERTLALHVSLDDGGRKAAGGAMPAALSRLREVLEDARLYARNRRAYDRRGLREMNLSRLDLERLSAALAGELPVVVGVSRSANILRVLALADEYGIDLILSGAEEAWRVAEPIAAADVPVIVRPLTNLPSSFSRLGARYDNAALLAEAGVRVVIRTGGAHGQHNLRQEAGNAVAWGLDRQKALRALTLEPATVFGMQDDYGSLTPGKAANVVVWSGDPFELTTRPTLMLIDGEEVPLRSRQTELLERYRSLEGVSRGVPSGD